MTVKAHSSLIIFLCFQAVCLYWTTTNFVSLGQVAFLKVPAVRRYFEIPEKKAGVKASMKKSGKGVVNDIKSSKYVHFVFVK